MIDAHVHFWKYDKVKDGWITDEMKLLQRDFLPHHLKLTLEQNGISGVIAVQASQSEAETSFLLALARENPEIEGIVGWTDLQSDRVEERLQFYSQSSIIKGFRHIIQAELPGFMKKETFLRGIRSLKFHEFTYDLLLYPGQLEEAIVMTNQFPEQKFIIDHCAKPCIRKKELKQWDVLMREMAQNKNIYCKLSGLITEASWNNWDDMDFYPYLDSVFDCFGPDRILFGGDWPVLLVSGKYDKWKNLVTHYMNDFSKADIEKVFRSNAISFYNLVS